jgi:hypothetical protein
MNEPSTNTTFSNRIGKSNIDLTLITNNLLRRISDWKISDEESNSDHSLLNYSIRTDISYKKQHKNDGTEIYSERGKHKKNMKEIYAGQWRA